MPKKVGFLYDKMCDRDLIRTAIMEGTKGKRGRKDIDRVLADVDGYVEKTYQLLVSKRYVPTVPRSRVIFDKSSNKRRVIRIVPFYPDGLMHQLCTMVLQPVIMRGMYRWSCASIPGRGNRCAAKYIRRTLDNDAKNTKYCLKMDVKQYYPSIAPKRLIWALARKVKDKQFLKLVYDIISSNPDGGLAIGFYVNQWLANYYLESLDNFILTLPGVKYYVRNLDDMVILGPNKKLLHKARKAIADFLIHRLGLRMKENWQVFPTKHRPVDLVGYRFYRTHTTLRRRNFLRLARQCRRVRKKLDAGRHIPYTVAAGLLSRVGQLKHCDGYKVRSKYFDPVGEKPLKEVVRREGKRRLAKAA